MELKVLVWLLLVIAVPHLSLRISLGEKRGKGLHFPFGRLFLSCHLGPLEQVDRGIPPGCLVSQQVDDDTIQ